MEIIKEYKNNQNIIVRVIKGDVTKISADVCICGRARNFLQELKPELDITFDFLMKSISSKHRKIEIATSERLPWKNIVRINYKPGPKNPYRFAPNHLPHSIGLSQDIVFIIDDFITFRKVNTILILPLSIRNPDTVCAATASAIKAYSKEYGQFGSEPIKTISVVDKDDPSPFISWFDKQETLFEWYSDKTEFE